jgi:poly(3-hydroxybutyrate) depolymerase
MVDALLSKLEAAYCIDQDRVFAVGQGTGALLVTMLGCVRGDVLRGVAPLSGAPPPGGCVGEPAVWIMQASADPSTFGIGRANRDFWADRNGCDVTLPGSVAPPPCVEYAGCDVGSPVRYCEYDGDLALPSSAAGGVWSFFKGL